MTIVVPAGNKKVNWVPSENKLQKTASTEGVQDVQEESNPLYEAAKSFLASKEAMDMNEDLGDDAPCLDAPCVEDNGAVDGAVDVADEKSISEAVKEVEEKAAAAEEKIEAVQQAVEQIGEAVESAKDACAEAGVDGEGDGEEIEVEIGVQDDDEVEIEVKDNGEGEDEDGLVVESEPEVEDEAIMDRSASAEEFARYSMISPSNRKKLADYWINALGYPRDYVNLLVKDYE